MRIISQDGTLDFPYELSTIRVYNEIISMGMRKDDSCRSIIARYSTEAKALKAMEMLRKVYENNVFYHCTASSKRFEEVQSILSEEQFRKATTEYFQFPQDDEIEV